VHLVYLDEAGIDGRSASVTFGALIVPPGKFGRALMLHETAIQQIIPPDSKEEFKQFHACDLYWGNKAFRKVKDEQRHNAITVLLMAMRSEGLSFIYSSVNREEFYNSPLGTIPFAPLHFAFQICLRGVENWARVQHCPERDPNKGAVIKWEDSFLCIADESNNEPHKDELKAVYRKLRPKRLFHNFQAGDRLFHAHDAMFFVDSVDSVGIQIADLCTYFVQRKLNGKPEKQNFLDMFLDRVMCAKPEPEWTQYKHLLKELPQ
jgi:hypothetical protein